MSNVKIDGHKTPCPYYVILSAKNKTCAIKFNRDNGVNIIMKGTGNFPVNVIV